MSLVKYPEVQKVYKHEQPFSRPLDENIIDIKNRIQLRKASMVVIDGAIGEGKTTLGVHVADFYQSIVSDLGFSPINLLYQLAMGGVDFQEKLKICIDKKLKVIIYDEAGDFNKRGSLTGFNQQLNRVFEMYRTYGILVILILPNFGVLDNSLFEKQIPRMLLHTEKRTKKYGRFKAYSLYRMYYIRKKMTKFTVPPHAYTQTQPNFYASYFDLDPIRAEKLDTISTEGKLRTLSENIIRNNSLMCIKEIAAVVKKSVSYVKAKVRELNLPHELEYRNAFYYAKTEQEIIFRIWPPPEEKRGPKTK